MQDMDDALYLALDTDRNENGKPTGKCTKEGFLLAIRQRFLKSFEQVVDQLVLFCVARALAVVVNAAAWVLSKYAGCERPGGGSRASEARACTLTRKRAGHGAEKSA